MDYHELRVLVPAESDDGRKVMGGVEASRLLHSVIAPVVAERLNETAPVLVLWESCRPAATSGAL